MQRAGLLMMRLLARTTQHSALRSLVPACAPPHYQGTGITDEDALAAYTAWINSLGGPDTPAAMELAVACRAALVEQLGGSGQ